MGLPHLTQSFPASTRLRSLGLPGSDQARVLQDLLFGAVVLSATATLDSSASTFLVAEPYIARWAFATTTGWTLTGANRTTTVFPGPTDSNFGMRLSLTDALHKVGILLPTSEDGRNGYLARVEDTGVARMLRLSRLVEGQIVDEGAGVLLVPNGASDVPPAASAEVDVSTAIGASQAYTLDARVALGVVEVRINDETDARIKHNTATAVYTPVEGATFRPKYAGIFPDNHSVAFQSSVNGARVLSARLLELTGVRSSRADVIIWVCGGNVYACADGANAQQIAASVFPVDATVDMDEFNGNMVLVGGGLARLISSSTLAVSLWTPTDGTLPGQTAAGTTTANIVSTIRSRLALADIDGDEQNVVLCATNDHLDWNTGKDIPGAAYAYSGYKATRLGQPVKAVLEDSAGNAAVGTTGQIYLVVGDPALGQIEALPKSNDAGVSGKDAMWNHPVGAIVAHSPRGLLSMTDGVRNVTEQVLTTGIQFPTVPEDAIVLVMRDPQRHGTHIIISRDPAVVPEGGTSYWYDERAGNFAGAGMGGFHPERYPPQSQPTCAAMWLGRPVFGTFGGTIVEFKDAATSSDTDDGTPVESYATLPQLVAGTGNTESLITRMELVLAAASSPIRIQISKARTAEENFKGVNTSTPVDEVVEGPRPAPLSRQVRGPSLLVRLSGSGNGIWRLERFDAATQTGLQRSIGG